MVTDEQIAAALKAQHACCSKREVAAVRSLFVPIITEIQQAIKAMDGIYHKGDPAVTEARTILEKYRNLIAKLL